MAGTGETIVTVINNGQHYTTEINSGTHSWIADEPAEAGGRDEGPRPHELLAGALGSCTAITVNMYAFRKSWPLDGVEVRVSIKKNILNGVQSTQIYQEVRLIGLLDDEQRHRLMEIAGKCPVHKTLLSDITIQTVPKR